MPSVANDVVIDPYTETTEGTEIYFHCDRGFYPNDMKKAVCSRDRIWTPDPLNHMCFRGILHGYLNLICNTGLHDGEGAPNTNIVLHNLIVLHMA